MYACIDVFIVNECNEPNVVGFIFKIHAEVALLINIGRKVGFDCTMLTKQGNKVGWEINWMEFEWYGNEN